ncbi:putative msf1 domain protein [Golovinomyces cichoracearum]|uniref:Putative msf1 domain protein n=1 Tax=Golovinomyces cichoracearum TaxID=62708 RepID=A0A420J210_9PEZI|nr:putative msf1 domain protein [Golovinomyces cichoracearum]
MVKFYESAFKYDYSFPAVTLAYFLRYPNPYSTHVLSTDVISRDIDSQGRLHSVRVHRKRTRLPSAVLKFLPTSVLGSLSNSSSESFILERSTVDIKEGWMRTESKNLDWTGILSVVEKQEYRRQLSLAPGEQANTNDLSALSAGKTDVVTTVIFRSRIGSRLRAKASRTAGDTSTSVSEIEDEQPKKGFLASLSTYGVQRSIEAIASRRTENQLGKSKEGMVVVLERLRSGGLMAVLDGMRKDREIAMAPPI